MPVNLVVVEEGGDELVDLGQAFFISCRRTAGQ